MIHKYTLLSPGVTQGVNSKVLEDLSGSASNSILAMDFNPGLVNNVIDVVTNLQDCRAQNQPAEPSESPGRL